MFKVVKEGKNQSRMLYIKLSFLSVRGIKIFSNEN